VNDTWPADETAARLLRRFAERVGPHAADQARGVLESFEMDREIQRRSAKARGVRELIPQHFTDDEDARTAAIPQRVVL